MEIISSTSSSHNTPLWVSVRFSLKRMYTPHCQSARKLPNPVAEDESFRNGRGSSHFPGVQASLDLTVIGGAAIDSGVWGGGSPRDWFLHMEKG